MIHTYPSLQITLLDDSVGAAGNISVQVEINNTNKAKLAAS